MSTKPPVIGVTARRVALRYRSASDTRESRTRDVLDDLVRATGAVLRWLRQNPKRATPELADELRVLMKSVARVRELSGVRGGSDELWNLYVPPSEAEE
jgi:hypothetical protein